MACNNELRESGKGYPRTCSDCILGPCKKLGAKPVQTLSESQAEIARLQAEVERLKGFIRDIAKAGGDAGGKALICVRNDALEEAALECGHHLSTEDDVILAKDIAERIRDLKETP